MDTFATLAIAIATPFAYAAYNHPSEYKRYVYWPCVGIAAIAMIAMLAYQRGVFDAASAMRAVKLSTPLSVDAFSALNSAALDVVPSDRWMFLLSTAVAYLTILSFLPGMGLTRDARTSR